MLVERQEENNKLFGFKGVIGRRDFLFNEIIIFLLAFPFILPCIIYFLISDANYDIIQNFLEGTSLLYKLCLLAGIAATTLLNISNIWRRIKDVIWEIHTYILIIAIILILICLPIVVLFPFFAHAGFIVFPYIALYLILFFKEGQCNLEENKISDRIEIKWFLKRRKKILSIYFITCALLIGGLFIGNKAPIFNSINPEVNQEEFSPELDNSPQTIFTLETKVKSKQ